MAGDDEWVSTLMLTVAVCERIELLAGAASTSSAALVASALGLRTLATAELDQALGRSNPAS